MQLPTLSAAKCSLMWAFKSFIIFPMSTTPSPCSFRFLIFHIWSNTSVPEIRNSSINVLSSPSSGGRAIKVLMRSDMELNCIEIGLRP